jgi:hypothetical protein
METKTISIKGVEVTIRAPYAAGHVLTEHEAKALNQTRAENIGNNFRAQITAAVEGKEGAKSLDTVLAEIAAYDAEYQFTARAAGTRSTATPLEKMTEKVAKTWLIGKLKESGTTLKAYIEANGEAYVDEKIEAIMANESIQKLAKEELKKKEKSAQALAEIAI